MSSPLCWCHAQGNAAATAIPTLFDSLGRSPYEAHIKKDRLAKPAAVTIVNRGGWTYTLKAHETWIEWTSVVVRTTIRSSG